MHRSESTKANGPMIKGMASAMSDSVMEMYTKDSTMTEKSTVRESTCGPAARCTTVSGMPGRRKDTASGKA